MTPGEGWFHPLSSSCARHCFPPCAPKRCVCVRKPPRNGKGSEVLSLMRDEAAALLEPCGQLGTFPYLSFTRLVSEGGQGRFERPEVFSSSTDPMNTPFVLPQGDRSGNSRAAASACYLWVFLKLVSFFCPSQSILFSHSSPETMMIPISKWVG